MKETLGDSVPAYSTVTKQHAEFKRGRSSCDDLHQCGRPATSFIEETVEKLTTRQTCNATAFSLLLFITNHSQVIEQLHWLPIEWHIKFKVTTFTHKAYSNVISRHSTSIVSLSYPQRPLAPTPTPPDSVYTYVGVILFTYLFACLLTYCYLFRLAVEMYGLSMCPIAVDDVPEVNQQIIVYRRLLTLQGYYQNILIDRLFNFNC